MFSINSQQRIESEQKRHRELRTNVKKRKKKTGRLSMVFGTMEVNGKTFSGISYERITYDDGTMQEKGLPPGMPKGLSIPTLLELAGKMILE